MFLRKIQEKYQVEAKIISDRERAALVKDNARSILNPRSSAKPQPKKEELKKSSFLKLVKDKEDAEKFQKEIKEHKAPGSIEVYIDIVVGGTVYSSKKSYLKFGATRDEIQHKMKTVVNEKLMDQFQMTDAPHWYAGSDGKDGVYTTESISVPPGLIPWDVFSKKEEKEFQYDEAVDIMAVVTLKFPHLQGDELKGM